nr:hypothetical protein GCM10020241_43750 [Streptoalloteichus tenebrarius]
MARRVAAALAAFACVAGVGLATAGAAAADTPSSPTTQPSPTALAVESRSVGLVTSLGGTVGVAAVAAGVGGMVAGVLRRRRGVDVDPANERKE